MNNIAMLIRKYLEFNMSRIDNIFFNIHRAITERTLRLSLCRKKFMFKFIMAADNAHALASTAECSFYYNRITCLIRKFQPFLPVIYRLFCTGNYRDSCRLHCILCLRLIAETFDKCCVRTYELYIAFFT